MRLILTDNLHGTHLWRTAQSAGRESVDESLDFVCALVECARHTAHEMYHMAVVLQVFVEVHLHTMTVAAQVVARQVHQHHVFGIFLGVVAQELCTAAISLSIARTFGSAGNGVDVCLITLNAAMRFG